MDWLDNLTFFYSVQRLDLSAWCLRLSRLSDGFRTHFKFSVLFIHSFISLHTIFHQKHLKVCRVWEAVHVSRLLQLLCICSCNLFVSWYKWLLPLSAALPYLTPIQRDGLLQSMHVGHAYVARTWADTIHCLVD